MTSVALFPLQSGVFPDGVLQLQIFEVRYLDLIKRCQREAASFGVAWLAQGAETQVAAEQPRLFQFGCMVELLEVVPIMPTLLHVKCRGTRRFRLDAQFAGPYGVWQGRIEYLECDNNDPIPSHLQGLADRLGQLIARARRPGALRTACHFIVRIGWMKPGGLPTVGQRYCRSHRNKKCNCSGNQTLCCAWNG